MGLPIVVHPLEAQDGLLITREEGERLKDLVCRRLKELEPMSVLCLNFESVKFVDVSGADEVVVKVLARIAAGEFPNRFLIIRGVDPQHRENIEYVLEMAKRAVLVDLGAKRWTMLGYLNAALRGLLMFIGEKGEATARGLVEELGIEPVNTASTRLVQLYRERLVARVPWREPVRGGGRQFRYIALVRGKFKEA